VESWSCLQQLVRSPLSLFGTGTSAAPSGQVHRQLRYSVATAVQPSAGLLSVGLAAIIIIVIIIIIIGAAETVSPGLSAVMLLR